MSVLKKVDTRVAVLKIAPKKTAMTFFLEINFLGAKIGKMCVTVRTIAAENHV